MKNQIISKRFYPYQPFLSFSHTLSFFLLFLPSLVHPYFLSGIPVIHSALFICHSSGDVMIFTTECEPQSAFIAVLSKRWETRANKKVSHEN